MTETPQESIRTTCCVVGGGPAGVVLSLLLARQGVNVTLLEAHGDFDRDFRGDTLHPSTMEYMDQLGLAERILEIPHSKVHHAEARMGGETLQIADFSSLKTKFPWVTVVPQAEFLNVLVEEAQQYPGFVLKIQSRAQDLIEEEGKVCGVMYQHEGHHVSVRADLTVACDGRFSTLRKCAGLMPVSLGAPMDILWFRLPRHENDGDDLMARIHNHHMMVAFRHGNHWQLGYVIFKGHFSSLKEKGLVHFRNEVSQLMPELADRTEILTDWHQINPLSVESSRLSEWHKPGLLLIGDAAHVMSPVGGVGINYAIQDAVAASNILTIPLQEGTVTERDLIRVQKKREFATKFIQWFQTQAQERIIRSALSDDHPFRIPWIMRLPFFRTILPKLLAFGWHRPRLKLHSNNESGANGD